MSLFDHLLRLSLPLVPRFVVRRVARPYVAGETLDDAVRTVRRLNDEGAMATLDVLGEAVTDRERVDKAVVDYLRVLEAIDREKLRCNVSLKPTMMGLALDKALCQDSIARVAARAAELGSFVRIDMEDHRTVEDTLAIYRALRAEQAPVGVVLQAMLRRTPDDIEGLLPHKPNVRLVKGIYREPRQVAWRDPHTIREAFVKGLEQLLRGGAYVGIATHDEHLVFSALALLRELRLGPERTEFQMLLGVDPELRRLLIDGGHRLRVYVPFGRDWYAYSLRRLRENPTVALHVLRALLGRMGLS